MTSKSPDKGGLPRPSGERAGERGLACHGAALWMFCGVVDGVIVAISLIAATAHLTGAGGLFDALFVAKKMPQRLARGLFLRCWHPPIVEQGLIGVNLIAVPARPMRSTAWFMPNVGFGSLLARHGRFYAESARRPYGTCGNSSHNKSSRRWRCVIWRWPMAAVPA